MAAVIRYRQPASDKAVASNGTSAVTIYTFGTSLLNPDGSSGLGGIVDAIDVFNSDTVQHDVQLHVIASAGSLGNDTLIRRINPLPAGQSVRVRGPFRARDSATVQVKLGEAHTATAVFIKTEISELH